MIERLLTAHTDAIMNFVAADDANVDDMQEALGITHNNIVDLVSTKDKQIEKLEVLCDEAFDLLRRARELLDEDEVHMGKLQLRLLSTATLANTGP